MKEVKKTDNNLIKYISGFVDGQYFVVDQIYKGKQKFLPTEEVFNWYTKGYNDANNYYLNVFLKSNSMDEFFNIFNNQNTTEIIRVCYSEYENKETKNI